MMKHLKRTNFDAFKRVVIDFDLYSEANLLQEGHGRSADSRKKSKEEMKQRHNDLLMKATKKKLSSTTNK
jgi:hypothetical protein